MAYRDYWLGLTKEGTFGTFTASGIKFFPMDTADVMSGQTMLERRTMASGRALRNAWTGIYKPVGSFAGVWWTEYMGLLLKGMQFDSNSALAGTLSYLHNFVPSDTLTQIGLSAELQHTASAALFARGMVLNSMSLSVDGENPAEVSFDAVALDFVRASGTWGDGSAAPSVTASPTVFASTIRPFMSFETTVKVGGTVSYSAGTKLLSVSGGVATTKPEKFSLDIANNASAIKTLDGKVNPSNIHIGGRDITLSMDFDFDTVDNTWIDALKAGTTQTIEIIMTGALIEASHNYSLSIVLPKLQVVKADYPQANGALEHPVQTVEFKAMEDTTGYDIGFSLKDKQTTY